MPTSARAFVADLQQRLGLQLPADTVDTFKIGDPDTPVAGVAVTMMPTLDVLHRAAEMGCNLVIAHEPLFWNHVEHVAPLEEENDELLRRKRVFLEEHGLILWRFHDGPHFHCPDLILAGMVEELGWSAFGSAHNPHLFVLPPRTLRELAREVRERLGATTLRVVGEPNRTVSKVALAPGAPGFAAHRHLLQHEEVEVLLIGEAFEWETITYAFDAREAGMNKSLLILGHILSEQAGMKACAAWLRQTWPEMRVEWLPNVEPFWSPG